MSRWVEGTPEVRWTLKNITTQFSPQFFLAIYLQCQNFHYNMARGARNKQQSGVLTFMSFNQMHEGLAFPIAIYFIPQINNVSMHWLVISKESLLWWITYHVAFECAGVASSFDLARHGLTRYWWQTLPWKKKKRKSMQMTSAVLNCEYCDSTILFCVFLAKIT